MIYGFPSDSSVVPGANLTLHVSTDAPQFHTSFFRQGNVLEPLGDLGISGNPGSLAPLRPPDQDWGTPGTDPNGTPLPAWQAYDFVIPSSWRTGVYVAVFTELDADGAPISFPDTSTADGRDSKALFVVRSLNPGGGSRILYKLALFTWHAYNMTGDPQGCLYTGTNDLVSLHRPGGGTGGAPFTVPDAYDWRSPRETFAHWDADFIAWLERNNYQVDYCTDLDVHNSTDGLFDGYRLVLSVGHDEYWTTNMRDRISQFVDSGGNAALFSGNTCWWRVDFPNADQPFYGRSGPWFQLGDPENTTTGVSYRNAGGQWDGPRPQVVGYTVQNSAHWIYQGTGLQDGDVFGDYSDAGKTDAAAIVGYECDGAVFDRAQLGSGSPLTPTHEDGTPAGFMILGVADVTGWQDYDGGNHAATMGIFTRSGTVFTAATTDWSRVLNNEKDPTVVRITRNVLETLSTA